MLGRYCAGGSGVCELRKECWIIMEEIQSTYYGAYYEPLKELEQEVLGWLSELVDGLSDRQERDWWSISAAGLNLQMECGKS